MQKALLLGKFVKEGVPQGKTYLEMERKKKTLKAWLDARISTEGVGAILQKGSKSEPNKWTTRINALLEMASTGRVKNKTQLQDQETRTDVHERTEDECRSHHGCPGRGGEKKKKTILAEGGGVWRFARDNNKTKREVNIKWVHPQT